MSLLSETMGALGAVLLPVAAGLLFEELTFGGLVRLLLAPRTETGKVVESNHKRGEGK